MRKVINWALWVITAVLMYKLSLWAYEGYRAGGQKQEVLDIDKLCSVIADTGQCFCRHRQTKKVLSISYDECLSLANKNRQY